MSTIVPSGEVLSRNVFLAPDSHLAELSGERREPTSTSTNYVFEQSILGAALLSRTRSRVSDMDGVATGNLLKDYDRSWPHEQSQSIVYSRWSRSRPGCATWTPGAASCRRPATNDLIRAIEAVCQTIPPSVGVQITVEDRFVHAANEYLFQRLCFWIMSPSSALCHSIVNQLRGSNRTIRALYLAAGFLQTPSQDPSIRSSVTQGHLSCASGLEKKMTTDPYSSPRSDIRDHLMAHLELAALKFSLMDSSSGYTALRHALPKFLQLAVTDPRILVEQSDGNLAVSFTRMFDTFQYELTRFVSYEVVSAFLLGLPPLVDYVHDSQWSSSFIHPRSEISHGPPAVFFQIISQVNSWRTRPRVYSDGWQSLEERVLTWKSPYAMSDNLSTSASDSLGAARDILHEGWRHVVLIYIYMVGLSGSFHASLAQD
ncbi:hypothetical protein RSOLAG1IB_05049 [Rhizoctonia solani AG-1 IB]|uniref:Fungal zn(2)-Cys(6) binuclear cluster domain-containing protein n=1 Tax=Thanatephorus cucumeris (strain AG1-IB / isolate 7/3/14) TaxID=1108050 RepID=A0A0B7G2I1_THACB|nr:hypothetical protein RSOLAG1IB_05049 [Rhizoctonia solani AG-1 IB]